MGCYEVSLGDTIGVGTPGNLIRKHDKHGLVCQFVLDTICKLFTEEFA